MLLKGDFENPVLASVTDEEFTFFDGYAVRLFKPDLRVAESSTQKS